MTALANLVRADRQRLLERVDELDAIDREMRRPGTLAATCEPPALRDVARSTAERTTRS